jgi:hypothetical protein
MTERQWELYRLNVVEKWRESPHKEAVIGAIKHKLMILALQEKASDDLAKHNPRSFIGVAVSTPQSVAGVASWAVPCDHSLQFWASSIQSGPTALVRSCPDPPKLKIRRKFDEEDFRREPQLPCY